MVGEVERWSCQEKAAGMACAQELPGHLGKVFHLPPLPACLPWGRWDSCFHQDVEVTPMENGPEAQCRPQSP